MQTSGDQKAPYQYLIHEHEHPPDYTKKDQHAVEYTSKTWPEAWVNLPGHGLANVVHVIGIRAIQDLYETMQLEHEKRGVVNVFCVDGEGRDQHCVRNTPVLEARKIIAFLRERDKLPSNESKIFMSTATGNSSNNPAPYDAMLEMKIELKRANVRLTSTVCSSGLTSSGLSPRHEAVCYNEAAPLHEWPQVSNGLFNDFMAISKKHNDIDYDYMFHWGCISQNWLKSLHETRVSSWEEHEHWNILMTIAMMRHAMEKLRRGGTLCLKVRIFKLAQTHGLVALLSKAFQEFEIKLSTKNNTTFVVLIGFGFRGQCSDVKFVQEILARSVSYDPVDIFCHRFSDDGIYKAALRKCTDAAAGMLYAYIKRKTVWLAILREIEICITSATPLHENRVLGFLHKMQFSEETNEKCMHQVRNIMKSIQRSRVNQAKFLQVMNDPWMREAC